MRHGRPELREEREQEEHEERRCPGEEALTWPGVRLQGRACRSCPPLAPNCRLGALPFQGQACRAAMVVVLPEPLLLVARLVLLVLLLLPPRLP